MAECAEPRNMLVCYNCGRLEVTMRTCPRCGLTHSGFLAKKKEAAVVTAAQASDSRVDIVPVRAVEAAACSVGKTETTPADTPARRKKCRRSKKKAQQQVVPVPPPPRTPTPPRITQRESEPSKSKGTTYERFCHSLRRLSPATQNRLNAVWNGEHVCSSDRLTERRASFKRELVLGFSRNPGCEVKRRWRRMESQAQVPFQSKSW